MRGDAGARLHRPDRRTGPAERRDRRLSGAGAGAGADDLGILVCTQMSFTLGALTMEQTKHLTAADAGALAGLTSPAVAADLAAAPGRAGRRVRPAGAAAPAGQPDARHRARRVAGVPGR